MLRQRLKVCVHRPPINLRLDERACNHRRVSLERYDRDVIQRIAHVSINKHTPALVCVRLIVTLSSLLVYTKAVAITSTYDAGRDYKISQYAGGTEDAIPSTTKWDLHRASLKMQEASSISAIGYAWMIMHTQRRMLETHRHSSLLQRTFRRHIQAQKACVAFWAMDKCVLYQTFCERTHASCISSYNW